MRQCRGSIARAAFVLALLSSRPADAQVVGPGPTRPNDGLINDWVTGVWYDVANQQKAERRLQGVQARLGRDAERCDPDAVDRDLRRIESLKYRIVVDEWLIRKNSQMDPGCYPFPLRPHPISTAAIAQYSHPQRPPDPVTFGPTQGPMGPSRVPVSIANTGASGASLAFAIDGVPYQSAGASRQTLFVFPDSIITYDAGGSLGQRRYVISPGAYEFRSTPDGWSLFKLPNMP